MFDFSSTIEDINCNVNNIADDLISSNLDIRPIFYSKYKLLLELIPVKDSKFYKVTNISKTACYSNNRYIIPLIYFGTIIDYKMKRIIMESVLHNSYKEVYEKYKQIINITSNQNGLSNNINIYQDDIFEVAYLYGFDREETNGNVTVFIRFKEELNLDTINNLNNSNEFYDILNNITNKGVFDFLYYYRNIINKVVSCDFHPLYLKLLNMGYIKFYKDINNNNKFYILFNYKKLYLYMKDRDDSFDAVIKHMLGFNTGVTDITDFPYFPENKSSKNIILKNSTHTLKITLTNKIKNIPEYVLNMIRFDDKNTNNMGMYEITVIE